MNAGAMIPAPLDRLRVFVSSAIKECSVERAVIRDSIRSINHDPVLFEDIGARPYPPREVYESRLKMSHIFVGIYRESYGWVAPGMEISGVEDEYLLATKRGMDRLLYAYQSPSARDPKLQALLDVAMNSGITVAFCSDPAQLRDRVRNDLTAVISERFAGQALDRIPGAADVLGSLLPNRGHRFRRLHVEADLLNALRQSGRLVITAPLGGGKTILLAHLSIEHDWVFVDGQGLSRLDLLARAANALGERLGQRVITLTTELAAMQELARRWEALPDAVLAIDGAEEADLLWHKLAPNGRLVMTSRSAVMIPSEEHFPVPPLARDEIEHWVTAFRGQRPHPCELGSIVSRSAGNPLYLRFYALGEHPSIELSLRELEVRAFQSLPPRAREVASYLALSRRPFSLGDLDALLGLEEGPEGVAELLSIASGLLKQAQGHVQLVHQHLRTTLLDQLHQAPARLTFFAGRLGAYFEQSQNFLAAFQVYSEAGEQRHADRLIDQAANQAALMGGGAPAVPVFERRVKLARETGNSDQEVSALLALAYSLNQIGARDEASRALSEARVTAGRESDQAHLLRVREMELVIDTDRKPRSERIRDLEALRSSYINDGDVFTAARLGTLVTPEYIAGSDFVSAARVSREALQVFTELGDEYGIRLTRVNLASALSRIAGQEKEASAIAWELQHDSELEKYPRQRAVLCNFLTRHNRELGDTDRASEFAIEAIEIGRQLKDRRLISINRINLGNCRRDEKKLDQALIEYRAAEQEAVAGGVREGEAAANELIASVLNECEQYRAALQHAQHAAAVARLIPDPVLLARADQERAIALIGQREIDAAISAYTDAAAAIGAFRPGGSFFVSLVGDALSLCTKNQRFDLKLQLLSRIFAPDSRPLGGGDSSHPFRALCAALPSVADRIKAGRLIPIVALSVADLLTDMPLVIEGRAILQATRALLDSPTELVTNSRLAAVAAIMLAQSMDCLTLGDLVDIAERVARSSPNVYFKPHYDGASHWTVRIEIADGVVITLVQLDDSPVIARTTMILALLLTSLGDMIRERLLRTEHIPRQEAVINIASKRSVEAQFGPELFDLREMPAGYAVIESADVSRSGQPPILVVCSDDFPTQWRPNEHALSDVHLLFGDLLRVLVSHLLAKSIEPDVLFPKIGLLVREIGYRGAADKAHPRVGRVPGGGGAT